VLGSEVLDVAIGLILIFLLLSLLCSSIKEALETVLKYRARDLEHGIREMFDDVDRKHLVPEFYRHPLINALFRGNYDPNRLNNLPSYIPSRTFSLALTDLLRTLANKETPELKINAINSIADLRAIIAALPPDLKLRGALIPLVDAAGGNLELARKNIENWYDGAMDRVSGW